LEAAKPELEHQTMNKNMNRLIMTVGVALAAQGAWGQISYTNGTSAAIPDGNPVGYTESIDVSGLNGAIGDVAITLDVTGGFNGDLYAYLLSPDSTMAVLLNRVGLSESNPVGYGDSGFQITLDGSLAGTSAADIHNYQTVSGYSLSGTTWAADGRNIDPNSIGAVFDTASRTAGLDIYNGMNGSGLNGTWTLFIADLSGGGGTATLNQAILTITTVPEPQAWMMMGGGLATLILLRLRGC
jgi:subtilisin-like proprotein convertase family protein